MVHPLPLGKRLPQLTTFPSLGTFVPKCWWMHSTIIRTNQPNSTHTHHKPTLFGIISTIASILTTTHSQYHTQFILPYSIRNTILNSQYPGTTQIDTFRVKQFITTQSRMQWYLKRGISQNMRSLNSTTHTHHYSCEMTWRNSRYRNTCNLQTTSINSSSKYATILKIGFMEEHMEYHGITNTYHHMGIIMGDHHIY